MGDTVSKADAGGCGLSRTRGRDRVDHDIWAWSKEFHLAGSLMLISKPSRLRVTAFAFGGAQVGKKWETFDLDITRDLDFVCSETAEGCAISVSQSGDEALVDHKDGPLTIRISKLDVTVNGAVADVDVAIKLTCRQSVEKKVKVVLKSSKSSEIGGEIHAELSAPKVGKVGDSLHVDKKKGDSISETDEYLVPGEEYETSIDGGYTYQCSTAATAKQVSVGPKRTNETQHPKAPNE